MKESHTHFEWHQGEKMGQTFQFWMNYLFMHRHIVIIIIYQEVYWWHSLYCESKNCFICFKQQALSSDWPKQTSATVLCTFTGQDQLLRGFWQVAKLSLWTRGVFIHCFDLHASCIAVLYIYCVSELIAAASHQTELFRIWWSFRQKADMQ